MRSSWGAQRCQTRGPVLARRDDPAVSADRHRRDLLQMSNQGPRRAVRLDRLDERGSSRLQPGEVMRIGQALNAQPIQLVDLDHRFQRLDASPACL